MMFGLGIYKKRDVELYRELYESDEIVIQKLKLEIMELEESRDLVEFIRSIKDESIVSIVQNNDPEPELYVLTKREDHKSLTITMKNPYRKDFPFVNVALKKVVKVDETGIKGTENQELYIEDINAKNKRVGNGRILINTIINYAKEQHYKTIVGKITDKDKKDTPGLPTFYNKM